MAAGAYMHYDSSLSLSHFAFLNCLCLWTLHFLPADGNHWHTYNKQSAVMPCIWLTMLLADYQID